MRVEQADARFKLVAAPGHSYYRTLREKLGWGGRLEYSEHTWKPYEVGGIGK